MRSLSPSVVTTKTKTHAQAQAHELKISFDHPVSSSSSCYFEHDQMCDRATKSGICPIDNRPCKSNRNYLNKSYKPATQHQFSPEDQEWEQRQWRQNEREKQTFNHHHHHHHHHHQSNDDLQEKRNQERLRLDVMEEAPRQGYPARIGLINNIIDTFRIAAHIGKLVVGAVVYQVHFMIKKNADRGKGRQQQ